MSDKLQARKWYKLVKDSFGETLEPLGFSSEESKYCTFWRKMSDDIYHIIMPDRSRTSPQYDIHVFPHSPRLEEEFYSKFPDNLGITTDCAGYLHSKTGVGMDQEWYRCLTEEGYTRNFEQKVKPALLKYAVPFLDQIKTFHDMRKVINRGPYVQIIDELLKNA